MKEFFFRLAGLDVVDIVGGEVGNVGGGVSDEAGC